MTRTSGYLYCPFCSSRRAAYYDHDDSDFDYYCHSCEKTWNEDDDMPTQVREKKVTPLLDPEDLHDWPNGMRGITSKAAKDMGLCVLRIDGKIVAEVAEYRDPDSRELVFQKAKYSDGSRKIHGESRDILWGEHKFRQKGKRIYVAEGEADAASIRTVMHDWPVVSIPHGAQSAKRIVPERLKFLTQFDEIVLCFDMDEPGRNAAKEVAELLPPGRVRVVGDLGTDIKDANELLRTDTGRKELPIALIRAPFYSPIEILKGEQLWDELMTEVPPGRPWWCPGLNQSTRGRRDGELSLILGSTASGKTSFAFRQLVEDLRNGCKVGVIALEEGPDDVLRRILGEFVAKPLYHKDEEYPPSEIAQYRQQFAEFVEDRLVITGHKGAIEAGKVDQVVQWICATERCDVIYVDHITLAAAGAGSVSVVEELMANLISLKAQYPVHVTALCQLKKGDKDFELGAPIAQSDSFGSTAIMNAANVAIGVERKQTTEEAAKVRLVKRRRGSAPLGVYDGAYVDPITGCMHACKVPDWNYEWDKEKRQHG